jgi:hypothetical protein
MHESRRNQNLDSSKFIPRNHHKSLSALVPRLRSHGNVGYPASLSDDKAIPMIGIVFFEKITENHLYKYHERLSRIFVVVNLGNVSVICLMVVCIELNFTGAFGIDHRSWVLKHRTFHNLWRPDSQEPEYQSFRVTSNHSELICLISSP